MPTSYNDALPTMVYGRATVEVWHTPQSAAGLLRAGGRVVETCPIGGKWVELEVYSFTRMSTGYNYSIKGGGHSWCGAQNARNLVRFD